MWYERICLSMRFDIKIIKFEYSLPFVNSYWYELWDAHFEHSLSKYVLIINSNIFRENLTHGAKSRKVDCLCLCCVYFSFFSFSFREFMNRQCSTWCPAGLPRTREGRWQLCHSLVCVILMISEAEIATDIVNSIKKLFSDLIDILYKFSNICRPFFVWAVVAELIYTDALLAR